jgi:hypothetical protein
MASTLGCSFKRRQRRIILASGLPQRGADYDLKKLILASARIFRRAEVFIRNLVRTTGNFID